MKLLRTSLLVATLVALLSGAPVSAPYSGSAAMTPPSRPSASQPGATATEQLDADARRAGDVLEELASRYRYLDGVTVSLGTTPGGEQAVAYYIQGDIVISRTHTVDVETILAHEVWHVIDWRDNGRLDWGEHVPPVNSYAYLNR